MNETSSYKLGGFQAWLVVLVSGLFFFYEFVQLNMFNVINLDLMRDFSINAIQVSNLSAGYLYADVLLLIPAGIILDRLPTRWVLSIAMAMCIGATFIFSMTHSFHLAFAMRLISGMGAAFNLLSSLRLASRWFPASHLAIVTGAVVTMAMLGGVVSQTPMTLLSNAYGWRDAVRVDATMGVLCLLLIIAFVRDYPKGYNPVVVEHSKKPGGDAIKAALSNAQNWCAGLYTSFLNLPILVFGALWGINYLVAVDDFSSTQASVMTSMIFIGMIFGSPLIGWYSDRIMRRKMPMILTGIISLFIVLLIRYIPDPSIILMNFLFLLLGFFISGQVLSYPLITESNSKHLTATALGLSSVLIMGGGAVFQPVMGWLLDLHSNHTVQAGTAAYSVSDYHFAFMIFPIMMVVGIMFAFCVRETYCKEES
jgi:MFS family permease